MALWPRIQPKRYTLHSFRRLLEIISYFYSTSKTLRPRFTHLFLADQASRGYPIDLSRAAINRLINKC